ncbi:MAG: hypothetical protein JJU21_00130 [Salinarimonas sp.]|nr:hypothetical protein [Salinarimonas sp.]
MVGSRAISGLSRVPPIVKIWGFLVLFVSMLGVQFPPNAAAPSLKITDGAHPALVSERAPGTVDIRLARALVPSAPAEFEEDTQAPPRRSLPSPVPSYAAGETVRAPALPVARRKGFRARAPPILA